MKKYSAIFFDWDGTAVLSRKAPVDTVVEAMRPLLDSGTKLAIISGTTYENIANGNLHVHFTASQLDNLYLGLGRGALDYGFSAGKPVVIQNRVPAKEVILGIHDACYRIHRTLLKQYGMETDIVFSRPNYCKIDLMPNQNRKDNLFLQEGEAAMLKEILRSHGVESIEYLLQLAESLSTQAIPLKATTDAKYLEVGPTGKSDNVDALISMLGLSSRPEDCCFWGDEFVGVSDETFGSDSGMITAMSQGGDFYDVSTICGNRPAVVRQLGGGVGRFIEFLAMQNYVG